MNDATVQLTIRGLNPSTKQALVKKAGQQGVSLNKYALKALQQSAGLDSSNDRQQSLHQFLASHRIDKNSRQAIKEALAWSDQVSMEKQNKEEP